VADGQPNFQKHTAGLNNLRVAVTLADSFSSDSIQAVVNRNEESRFKSGVSRSERKVRPVLACAVV
jgi:hypothetical protein